MLLLILSCSHKRDKKPEGFVLQEFNIIENQLYELLKSMHDSAYILKNNIVAYLDNSPTRYMDLISGQLLIEKFPSTRFQYKILE